jgi:hypothetical protein
MSWSEEDLATFGFKVCLWMLRGLAGFLLLLIGLMWLATGKPPL